LNSRRGVDSGNLADDSVRDAVQQQLAPRDFVEHMLAAEFIDGEWETLRLRRFKTMNRRRLR
jgi:hypothetical protein